LVIGTLNINIKSFRIANVDTGSAITIGHNVFYDWKTQTKSNNGFGRLSGDANFLSDMISNVEDPDWQDMNCTEGLQDECHKQSIE